MMGMCSVPGELVGGARLIGAYQDLPAPAPEPRSTSPPSSVPILAISLFRPSTPPKEPTQSLRLSSRHRALFMHSISARRFPIPKDDFPDPSLAPSATPSSAESFSQASSLSDLRTPKMDPGMVLSDCDMPGTQNAACELS